VFQKLTAKSVFSVHETTGKQGKGEDKRDARRDKVLFQIGRVKDWN
jgi:hypothetical protein